MLRESFGFMALEANILTVGDVRLIITVAATRGVFAQREGYP